MKTTVESCLPGHPDKASDAIADFLLDEYLRRDSQARVAVEVMGTNSTLLIGGEVNTKEQLSKEEIINYAKIVLKDTGSSPITDFIIRVHQQSQEISKLAQVGAGDSGIVYGYATAETENMMPPLINKVHERARKYFETYRADVKVKLTLKEDGRITEISKIQGRDFIKGSFEADTGLTGRKAQVDTYCGLVRHGGGSFSGKDGTKVDRSGAYMARWLARHIVQRYGWTEATVGLAYEIGIAQPVMISVSALNPRYIERTIKEQFDLSPRAIIERFGLNKPIYYPTSCYGHFGRMEFPWEKI